MKRFFLGVLSLVLVFGDIYAQQRSTGRKNTAIVLSGTSVKARLIYVASTPIEGAPSGPRIFVARIEGYAITPSGNKINMDGNYLTGWALGDAVSSRIAINFNKLSYYFDGEPIETPVNAWTYHNGLAGIPATIVVSKEFDYISKIFTVEFLKAFSEVFSKSIVPDIISTTTGVGKKIASSEGGVEVGTGQTNIFGYSTGSASASVFSALLDYYNAQLNMAFPQLMTTNNLVVEVVFVESFNYSSKDWIDIENAGKGRKEITENSR